MRMSSATLPRTFWLYLLLPRAALLGAWLLANHFLKLPLPVAAALIAADLLLLAWQIRVLLQAADAHVRSTGAMAPVWGSYLVVLFAGFAMLTVWWDTLLIATRPAETESFAARMDRLRAESYSLAVTGDGETLAFKGAITFGLKARIQEELDLHPNIRRITLSSPGGHIYAARAAAQLIEAQGFETMAQGECSSACTLLFAAGSQRSLAPGARLGFHGYALQSSRDKPQVSDIAAEQEKDRAFLHGRGLDTEFLQRALATPSSSMWFPTPVELQAAGVLTE